MVDPAGRAVLPHVESHHVSASGPAAVFTIASANYLSLAATLMQSVRHFHPDLPRFIMLSDVPPMLDGHVLDGLDLAAELVPCSDLETLLLGNMALWYSVTEFTTALNPFTFQHFLERRRFAAAIYLDPDIQLYAPLDDVLDALPSHSLVLTPHITEPLQDGKHPSDLAILKSGLYNLGFAAVSNDVDGLAMLRWWGERLFAHGRVDVPGHMFTDQRWMDLAPLFVERCKLLRHPGYNVAYWNLAHRRVRLDEAGWTVNGLPLKFFHFSGIQPDDPAVFSRHQDRFTVSQLGPVAGLCDEYRAAVLRNGWRRTSRIPYGHAGFADGRPIADAMRHWLLRALDDGRLPSGVQLTLASTFFDVEDDPPAGGGRLTRFAHQLWRDRADLRNAFDLGTAEGCEGYLDWLCLGAAEQGGVERRNAQAARRLRHQGSPPPWPRLATQSWNGPARDAADWLTGSVAFTLEGAPARIERQAALLWELRDDLQRCFPLRTHEQLDDYQLWVLTDGMAESIIQADLFTPAFLAWLAQPAAAGPGYGDVPVTQGMMATRKSSHARDGLQAWPEFPTGRRGRMEHAWWFACIAPRQFGWPDAVTAPVRAYFDAPSDFLLGQYRFTRGMMVPWEVRDDLQAAFPLHNEASCWRYLGWLLGQGAREYRLCIAELCPGLREFLASPCPEHPRLSRLLRYVHDQLEDLRQAFDLTRPADVVRLLEWSRPGLADHLRASGQAALQLPLDPPTPLLPLPPISARLALTGDWTVPSGIGEDLRSTARALDACGFTDYVIVNLPDGAVLTADRTELPRGTPVQVAWNVIFHNADTAMKDWLALRRLGISAGRTAAHWQWELERLPSAWLSAFSFCDEVWASSRFVLDCFAAEARRPVRLLHPAVDLPQASTAPARSRFGLDMKATVFLFMFDVASYATRKNPQAVIEAFGRAFPAGDEPAQLLIKSQNAALQPALWTGLQELATDRRVILRDEQLDRADLVGLLAAADAFVSLHRSEGFGRAPAEAMALGIPVILTGYSGTNDFADAGCACMVGYDLVPVPASGYPGVEGQLWAEADVDNAARCLRWVFDHPQAAREMGRRGQTKVQAMLSPALAGAAVVGLMH